jgi:hypothetical protein
MLNETPALRADTLTITSWLGGVNSKLFLFRFGITAIVVLTFIVRQAHTIIMREIPLWLTEKGRYSPDRQI